MAKVKLKVTVEALSSINMFCFSFRGNRTIFGRDITNSIFDLENSRSRSNPMVTFEPKSSIDMFGFRFVAIGPFLAEIQQIRYLTLKIQGQGRDKNEPKSNQVICRSGPTIVPKMKKILKVVQKLSCGQESAGGGGGVRTGTKT